MRMRKKKRMRSRRRIELSEIGFGTNQVKDIGIRQEENSLGKRKERYKREDKVSKMKARICFYLFF